MKISAKKKQAIIDSIDFDRINSDSNGNPRYVCHFLTFLTDKDDDIDRLATVGGISASYALALSRARSLGGKKFHNKQYGGGIVFQSYNIETLKNDIFELVHCAKQ